MFGGLDWSLLTDVSARPVGPSQIGQAAYTETSESTNQRSVTSQKSEYLSTRWWKPEITGLTYCKNPGPVPICLPQTPQGMKTDETYTAT
jgi:hypothetical protein